MKLPAQIHPFHGSSADGPNVVVLGGTHGDEITGVKVIERLCSVLGVAPDDFGEHTHPLVSGNLFLGFGNPQAIALGKRGVSNRDLNRCFVPEHLDDETNPDYQTADFQRARELRPLFEQTDFLFDLHGTSGPSVPFVCFGKETPEHQRFHRLVPVRYILTDPSNPSVLGVPYHLPVLGTTDYYVNTFGGGTGQHGIALCYETGQMTDLSKVEEVFSTTLQLLIEAGVFSQEFFEKQGLAEISNAPKQEVFRLVECVTSKDKEFEYSEGMLRGWQLVTQGQELGRYPKLGLVEKIPCDGLLLFPKPSKNIRFIGDSLYYIAEKIG